MFHQADDLLAFLFGYKALLPDLKKTDEESDTLCTPQSPEEEKQVDIYTPANFARIKRQIAKGVEAVEFSKEVLFLSKYYIRHLFMFPQDGDKMSHFVKVCNRIIG